MNSFLKDFLNEYSADLEIINKLNFKTLGFDLRNPLDRTLTFCNSVEYILNCIEIENISAIITRKEIYDQVRSSGTDLHGKGIILTSDPKNLFFKLHNHLCSNYFYKKETFNTIIDDTAIISKNASISPNNVVIGKHSIIEDFAVIKSDVTVGDHTRIQSGAVIGNDCLQCLTGKDILIEVIHIGGVKIGSFVKIESNSIVCKHIFNEYTQIADYVKIGGLVHVSHGCRIGERSILTANILLGGSTYIGCDVFIGPNVTTAPMITIGDRSRLTIGSVVTKDVGADTHVTGNFAIPHDRFIENLKNSL